jgi:hypothetical protein
VGRERLEQAAAAVQVDFFLALVCHLIPIQFTQLLLVLAVLMQVMVHQAVIQCFQVLQQLVVV